MKKPNITPGEWEIGTQDSNGSVDINEAIPIIAAYEEWDVAAVWIDCPGANENAKLIVTAGNLTNKNFRIEAIEEMYEVLKEFKFLCLEWDKMHPDTAGNKAYKRLKQALKNAKYE